MASQLDLIAITVYQQNSQHKVSILTEIITLFDAYETSMKDCCKTNRLSISC